MYESPISLYQEPPQVPSSLKRFMERNPSLREADARVAMMRVPATKRRRGRLPKLRADSVAESVKRIPSASAPRRDTEEVPDFSHMLECWQQSTDCRVIRDLTVRGDRALRRALYSQAREWLPQVRAFRVAFKQFAHGLGMPRSGKVEPNLARVLFGRSLDTRRVSEYGKAMRHWFEHPEATLADAEATRIVDITRPPARHDEEGEAAAGTSTSSSTSATAPIFREEVLVALAVRPATWIIPPPTEWSAESIPEPPGGAVVVQDDDGSRRVWDLRDAPAPVMREIIGLVLRSPQAAMPAETETQP